MIEGKYLYLFDDKTDAYNVREQVFQKELGMTKEADQDGADEDAVHGVIYVKEVPIGAARMQMDGTTFTLERVCVIKEMRGNDYAEFLVRMMTDKAFLMHAEEIMLDTPEDSTGLFDRIGFLRFGEVFIKEGIPYTHMRLRMTDLVKCCNKK